MLTTDELGFFIYMSEQELDEENEEELCLLQAQLLNYCISYVYHQ